MIRHGVSGKSTILQAFFLSLFTRVVSASGKFNFEANSVAFFIKLGTIAGFLQHAASLILGREKYALHAVPTRTRLSK